MALPVIIAPIVSAVVIGATTGARAAPYLSRMSAAAGGGAAFRTATDILRWIGVRPGRAAVAITTAASIGYPVYTHISESATEDSQFGEMLRTAIDIARQNTARMLEIASQSEKLDLAISENESDLNLAIEILSWARQHFGSADSAIRAHKRIQAFLEMPHDDVVVGYSALRIS